MSLRLSHSIALPRAGQADSHGDADQHHASGRLFVARPANDVIDVFDTIFGVYLYSVPELRGVSALVVGQALNEVFAADAHENKIAFFQAADRSAEKMVVGRRPAALAWDARRGVLWVANYGHPTRLDDCSLSMVDFVTQTRVSATLALPGRPHAMVYDERGDTLWVSLDDPARLVLIAGAAPGTIGEVLPLPSANVRCMRSDPLTGRTVCSCEDGSLLAVEQGGKLTNGAKLQGAPAGMALHGELRRLYVSHAESGTLMVLDADTLRAVETVQAEPGAGAPYLDSAANLLYLFCPGSGRAVVYRVE